MLAAGIIAIIVTVSLPQQEQRARTRRSRACRPSRSRTTRRPVSTRRRSRSAASSCQTAVVRKNLDWAYDNVHVDLKGRMSKAQWLKGNIPVIPFDSQNADTTAFIPQFSLQREVEFEVMLIPKIHVGVRGEQAAALLPRPPTRARQEDGRWLVSYFEPHWKPPVPLRQ